MASAVQDGHGAGGAVDDSLRRRAEYSADASNYRVVPQVVVFPRKRSTEHGREEQPSAFAYHVAISIKPDTEAIVTSDLHSAREFTARIEEAIEDGEYGVRSMEKRS